MSILIFILVLVVLIVVHELGHFVAAKITGMRVDEFGLGYPPRALTITKKGDTEYTLNWLPFGGFVRIFGEDGAHGDRSFTSKNRAAQAFVLAAGVVMNLVFAYVLVTSALMIGTPRALGENELAHATNTSLAVAGVLPDSPAADVGLLTGDTIVRANILSPDMVGSWQASNPESFSDFVNASEGRSVSLTLKRGDDEMMISATPVTGLTDNPARYALGVEVATVGVVPLTFGEAVVEGARLTWGMTKLTAVGLWHFFAGIATFSADISQVAGPVGIAGVVGSSAGRGLGDLLSIMAIISINLALINLIPIPALDGGRLLFVFVESITRRPIKARIAQTVNTVGFAALVLLMLVVTAHDIFKLVG